MVRLIKTSLLLFGLICFSLHAQYPFEGMISYEITYTHIPDAYKKNEMYMPTHMFVLIKGHMQRMELKTIMGPSIALANVEKRESYALTSLLGKKIALYTSPEQHQKIDAKMKEQNLTDEKRVEYTKETKRIAGYSCKKVLVHTRMDGKPVTFIIYVCAELPPVANALFNNGIDIQLEGCLMQYTLIQNGIEMQYTVTNVEKRALDDALFQVPADYQISNYQLGY